LKLIPEKVPNDRAPPVLRILMEMRPALDGYYGIPQETRLLFAALTSVPGFVLTGLLQLSKKSLRGGVYGAPRMSEAERVHRFSRVIVSIKGRTAFDWKNVVSEWLSDFWQNFGVRIRAWSGLGRLALGAFETKYFSDFIWQELYARSLPVTDRTQVLKSDYRVCTVPWRLMHMGGIERAQVLGRSRYPKIDTTGVEVFVAQTPFPGRVAPGTKLIVHYHDAIPLLMPHNISDRAFHQASHYHALAANVRDGAYFVCVSETTRMDLLSLFPEAAERTVTIHNMLPSHYFPAAPEPERVPDIIRRYLHGEFDGRVKGAVKNKTRIYRLARMFGCEEEKATFYRNAFSKNSRFLLMVSTIEPRKNHARLIAAWEVLHSADPDLKLVLVGHIGWDYHAALEGMLPWIEEGSLFLLQNVPVDALRILYRMASVTVCPSVGEGFDFSGVEAMRCGGIVAASDIPVHREIYRDASVYFDPYDTASLVAALQPMIYGETAATTRMHLQKAGMVQTTHYLPEKIIPQWVLFLKSIEISFRK
jgi:glycosyltransferase involved in cell wall biosynthesis